MSSEPFEQVGERIKREFGPSGLKLKLPIVGATGVVVLFLGHVEAVIGSDFTTGL
jgi:hypothetical protein